MALGEAVPAADAVGLQVVPPARGHEGLEVGDGLDARVDVDDRPGRAWCCCWRCKAWADDVHCATSCRRLIGRERIVHHDLMPQRLRQSRRHAPRRRRTASADSRRNRAGSRPTADDRRSGPPPPAASGASSGWMVRRKWSRKISAGERSTQGTSGRSRARTSCSRHRKAGTQVTPDSISTTLRPGNLANTPSVDQARDLRLEALRLAGVVLDVEIVPAERRQRVV